MKLLANPNKAMLPPNVAINSAAESKPRPSGPRILAVMTEVINPMAVTTTVVTSVLLDDLSNAAAAI
jgi:hypothetical protein